MTCERGQADDQRSYCWPNRSLIPMTSTQGTPPITAITPRRSLGSSVPSGNPPYRALGRLAATRLTQSHRRGLPPHRLNPAFNLPQFVCGEHPKEGPFRSKVLERSIDVGHVPQVGVTVHHPYQLLAGSLQQHLLA